VGLSSEGDKLAERTKDEITKDKEAITQLVPKDPMRMAFVYARTLPKRLEQRRVPSEEAVRAMVMAKSLIMTGALLAGGHAVYVGRWLSLMAAELPAARVWNGTATIVTAAICVLAGWLLERACMIDGDGDDTEPGEEREAPEAA